MLAACLALSSHARAEEDATATAAARERFKEGVSYFDQKQYEKARAAFVQAYALKKHPAVLLNLAQSELRSSHERDAAEHFASYLREATDASPAEREAAQSGLTTAKASVGELSVVADSGAEIVIDGTMQGLAPLPGPVYLEPGSHGIEARKGERSASQNVSIKAGESRETRVSLAAEAPAVAATGAAPSSEEKASSTHSEEPSEEATSGGREPFLHWVTTKPAGVIPAGATVLLGLGAGAFAIVSSLAYSDADDIGRQIEDHAREDSAPTRGICTDPKLVLTQAMYMGDIAARAAQYNDACSQHQNSVDRGDSFKTFAIVSGIGAGVLAVTTVVLYFTTAPHESASASSSVPRFAVLPEFAPGMGSINVVGRF